MTFEAEVRSVDGLPVIDLRGHVNADAADTLDSAYESASRGGAARILLSFAGTSYINSSGIALIVDLLGRARQRGQAVSVCGLSDHYRHIFEITRLSDYMDVHEDESSAVAAARS